MSTRRTSPRDAFPYRRDEHGMPLCRVCGVRLDSKRRTFCGQVCVDKYLMVRDPGHARGKVEKRDRGVCAMCGRDCLALELKIRARLRRCDKGALRLSKLLAAMGLMAGYFNLRRSLWDADHIVPVVEGGGECQLDNLRTLCVCCHKAETAALARRRAANGKPVQCALPLARRAS